MTPFLAPILLVGVAVLARARATPSAEFGARLLLVEKTGKIAFFLPESHIGTPAQHDRYIDGMIRVAFATSSTVLSENSAEAWLDTNNYHRACPLAAEAEAALDPARNAALRTRALPLSPQLRLMASVDDVAPLGRFIRFERLLRTTVANDLGTVPDAGAQGAQHFALPGPQSSQLMAAAPRRFASDEDTGTFFTAYCALAPTDRTMLSEGDLDKINAALIVADAGATVRQMRDNSIHVIDTDYRAALSDIKAILSAPFPAGQVTTPPATLENSNFRRPWSAAELVYHRFLIVERNRAWVAQLPTVLEREHLPFYAIGARHFADAPYRLGLITSLRDAGFNVSLVNNEQALRAALARLPSQLLTEQPIAPVPMVARMLGGGCLSHPGDTYACVWNDGTTSYHVMQLPQSSDNEIWSICYHRNAMYGAVRQHGHQDHDIPDRHRLGAAPRSSTERALMLAPRLGALHVRAHPQGNHCLF